MFSSIFIKRPILATVISLVLVIANYPGASSQTIAETVAAPIEAQVNSVENLIYYSSTCGNDGTYELNVTFEPGSDENMTLVNVIARVELGSETYEGVGIYRASVTGLRMRFRAVLMTALSFVIGVMPLLYATGAGAGARVSVGTVTFWGMLVATVAGMLLVPPLYVCFQRISEFFSGLRQAPAEDRQIVD